MVRVALAFADTLIPHIAFFAGLCLRAGTATVRCAQNIWGWAVSSVVLALALTGFLVPGILCGAVFGINATFAFTIFVGFTFAIGAEFLPVAHAIARSVQFLVIPTNRRTVWTDTIAGVFGQLSGCQAICGVVLALAFASLFVTLLIWPTWIQILSAGTAADIFAEFFETIAIARVVFAQALTGLLVPGIL